jgi:hypothetical protein
MSPDGQEVFVDGVLVGAGQPRGPQARSLRAAHCAIFQERHRVNPSTLQDLNGTADQWVDTAMTLRAGHGGLTPNRSAVGVRR